MQDKPRYSRISDILDLLIFMQSKTQGVSIFDIQKRFCVSRRTAERMRDSVLAIFPQLDEIETSDKCKSWGFTGGYLCEITSFSPEEIANLENLRKEEGQKGFCEKERLLASTVEKIRALSRKSLNKIENVLELLLETEGYAIK